MSRPMDDHPEPMDASQLAALYVTGALTDREVAEVHARLERGDAELSRELDLVRFAAEAMLESAPAVVPPAEIKKAVLATIGPRHAEADSSSSSVGQRLRHAHAGGADDDSSSGVVMLLEREGRWKSTGLRGVRYRTLHADRRANRRTIVLKMDPGSELPDHDHAGVEEVYMVSGDLAVGDTVLGPGDYFRAAAGAKHGIPRTTGGCVCIVISDYVPFPATSWLGFAWTALRGLFRRSPRA